MPNPVWLAARVLTGSTYAVLGWDALRTPGGWVPQAATTLAVMRRFLPLPADDEAIVRGNAAVQAVAGTPLALGAAPRLDTLALFGAMVPTTVACHGFWAIEDPVQRKLQRGPVPQEHGHARWAALRRPRPAERRLTRPCGQRARPMRDPLRWRLRSR
jgi:putative oxidoreductase